MKKNLALICLLPTMFFAQSERCSRKLNNFITKIGQSAPTNTVPFYNEPVKKWGLVDKNSKKIISNGDFKEPLFIKSENWFDYAFEDSDGKNGCSGIFFYQNNKYLVNELKDSSYFSEPENNPEGIARTIDYEKFLTEEIPGFIADKENNIVKLNRKFYDENYKRLLIGVDSFRNMQFGIYRNEKDNRIIYYSIIHPDGTTFKNFDKLPHLIPKNRFSTDEDVWFFKENKDKTFYAEGLFSGKIINLKLKSVDNWWYSKRAFGYVIAEDANNNNGVLDLTSLKWKVKPTKKFIFKGLNYTINMPVKFTNESDYSETSYNRNNSEIYIITEDNKVLDFNLKEIKPKK